MPPDDLSAQPAAPAPAPEAAAISPDAATEAAPSPPETPPPIVEPPAPAEALEAPEAPPEPSAEAPKLHTDEPTLIEQAGKTETPDQLTPEPEPPRGYEYQLPEGLTLDQERIAAANELFASHNLPQEAAQSLVDFHIAEMERYETAMLQRQHDIFANTRREWVNQVMADPEVGGNGHATAMHAVARMRDLFFSSANPRIEPERHAQEMAQFNDFLSVTGAGDHPAFVRFLHNVARKFDEPAAPSVPFRPPPDIGRRPNGATSRVEALYGPGTVNTTPR